MRDLNPRRYDGAVNALGIEQTPYVLVNDKFDIREFTETKRRSKVLLTTEEEMRATYPPFVDLQQSVYDSLFKGNPELHPEWQIKKSHLMNRELMVQLVETLKFKELRSSTVFDVINSVVGVEVLSTELQQLIMELKKQREALEAMLKAAKDAEAAAGEGEGGEEGEGDGEDEQDDNTGKKKKRKSSKKYTLAEAKKLYEDALANFREAMQSPEIKEKLQKIAKKTYDAVSETSDLISNWGLGSLVAFQTRPPHEKLVLVNKLRTPKMLRLAALVGRFRKEFSARRLEKIKVGMEEVYDIIQTSEISRLLPSELLRYLMPELEILFLADFIEGKTLGYALRGNIKKGKGPIVICVDSSGSMDGLAEIWSKAIAMVLLEISKEQKRDFYCIHFSSGRKDMHINEFKKEQPIDIEEMIDMAEYFEAGGTEFEPPLNLARSKIGEEGRYRKADIIFVTDGQAVVRDEWLRAWKIWMQENKICVFSVLIDSYANSDSAINEFSTSVSKLSNLKETNQEIAMDILLEI